ncbi:MAG: CAP domain-containing protein [Acidimicrobiales bacterium]
MAHPRSAHGRPVAGPGALGRPGAVRGSAERALRLLSVSAALAVAVVAVVTGARPSRSVATLGHVESPAPAPGSPATATSPPLEGGGWYDTSDRQAMVAAYRVAFGPADPPLEWAGDQASCRAGISSAASHRATIDRVNVYRALAGVPATVTEDPALSDQAQQTALMMSAEGLLSHEPGTDFACASPAGIAGAANSNLYLGRTGPDAVDGYIEDPGDHNTDVGHRATILHPPTRSMGVGDVDAGPTATSANALWVFDDQVFADSVGAGVTPMREPGRFVAWPPRGYVPSPLVHPRWSFTRAGVDVSGARISMYRYGDGGLVPIPVVVVDRVGAPGHVPLPTVVWEPDFSTGLGPEPERDTSYLVAVAGLRPDGAADPTFRSGYAYRVTVLGSGPSPGAEQPGAVLGAIAHAGP